MSPCMCATCMGVMHVRATNSQCSAAGHGYGLDSDANPAIRDGTGSACR